MIREEGRIISEKGDLKNLTLKVRIAMSVRSDGSSPEINIHTLSLLAFVEIIKKQL